MRIAQIVLVVISLNASVAIAQRAGEDAEKRDTTTRKLELKPAYFDGNGEKSVGGSWDASAAWRRKPEVTTPALPGPPICKLSAPWELEVEASTKGSAALDPDANTTPMSASLRAGGWRSISKPACPNPGRELATPGWYRGAMFLSLNAEAESNQPMSEANGSIGLDLTYVHSREDDWWKVMPSFTLQYEGVLPAKSDIRDSFSLANDLHHRAELWAELHVPLTRWRMARDGTPHSRFMLSLNGRFVQSFGLAAQLDSIGLDRSLFSAVDLRYLTNWPIAGVAITELFVRRVQGDVPEDWRQRHSWMLGIGTGGR